MIVLRFKVTCQPEKTEQLLAAMRKVVPLSRQVKGVIGFDIAQDILDPNTIVATEVFEGAAARERQESLPEVAAVLAILPECLAAPPEATVFEVSSAADAM
jgi:quinol monooxygenase YgiN